MSPIESMEQYGTMAFSEQYMNAFVGYGEPEFDQDGTFKGFNSKSNPQKINLSVWLGLVPDVFREMVIMVCQGQFELLKMVELANNDTKRLFCSKVCEEIKSCIDKSEHFKSEITMAKIRRASAQGQSTGVGD